MVNVRDRSFMSPSEVAEFLSLSPGWVTRNIFRNSGIPLFYESDRPRRPGDRAYILRSDFMKWLGTEWRISTDGPGPDDRNARLAAANRAIRRLRTQLGLLRSGSTKNAGSLPACLTSIADRLVEIPYAHLPPCIYFLIRNDRVVYVGQSINLASRIVGHLAAKDFDRIYYLPVADVADLDTLESGFIRHLRPELNRHPGKSSEDPMPYLERIGFALSAEAEQ